MHAIQERPVARQGNVDIRPMMYIALTYDHRIVDGREAVTFLKRIKDLLEEPARILLEVWCPSNRPRRRRRPRIRLLNANFIEDDDEDD